MLLVDKALKADSKFKKQIYVANIAKERIFKPALFKNVQLSGQVLQEIVNGVNGVNVVLHVDQENKTEMLCNKPNLVGWSVLETKLRIVTSNHAKVVNGVSGVIAVHPVDQENKPESSLVEKSVLKK